LEPLLDIPQVAHILSVSVATIRSWVLHHRIEFIKLGNSIRFRPSTIREMIANGVQPTVSVCKSLSAATSTGIGSNTTTKTSSAARAAATVR
jgi:excisionase family DNA binding protein